MLIQISLLFALSTHALASGFEGSIEFSAAEKALHEQTQDTVLREAMACSEADFNHHSSFFETHGISPYYGSSSEFAGKSEKAQKKFLKKRGLDPELLSQLESTSCIGYVLKCLEKGFKAARQEAIWQKLKAFTKLNNVTGDALQHGLQKLGWKLLYWLPDERRNRVRAIYEAREDPDNERHFWGFHEERMQSVRKTGMYLGNHVDDFKLLVNFGPQVPEALKKIPFYVGTAHGGYHVFGGGLGRVLEAHASVEIDDPKTMENSPFNPMNSDGPTEGMLFSGLIAIPAKYLP